MKNFVKKVSTLMLVLCLFIGLASGCSGNKDKEEAADQQTNVKTTDVPSEEKATEETEVTEAAQEENAIDLSEKVKLTMYMLGDKQTDHDLVWAEINKKLEEKLNATVEVKLLGWGEWEQQYALNFASGDKFDLIYTANWAKYVDQTIKGGFYPISEDMLKLYAPSTYENVPEAAWKQVKVNGEIYMVPGNDIMPNAFAIMIRGDLREKYGLPEIDSIEDYELYLATIAENEEGIFPYGENNGNNYWIMPTTLLNSKNNWTYLNCGGVDLMHFDYSDPNSTPFFRYDKPEYLEFVKKMAEWRANGYWSDSALTANTARYELFKEGKSASAIDNVGNVNGIYNEWLTSHPDWKLEVYDGAFGSAVASGSYLGNGMGIHATSENPERALMVIDALSYDKEINYLVRLGIEGKHYELSADGKVLPGVDAANYGQGYSIWSFNVKPRIQAGNEHPQHTPVYNAQEKRMVSHPLDAFVLNTENIKTEYAACKDIFSLYQPILELGFSEDPEKDIKDFISQLEQAGFAKVKEEIELQTKAFIEDYNK